MSYEPRRPLILGLETSCDETSAAVIDGNHEILGHVILSQDVHEVYGGVVPELAARAHLQKVDAVVAEALARAGVGLQAIDVFGVTAGPGLIGALLVGVCWTKAVAYGRGRPWVPVHHMEAHLFAPSLEDPEAEPPFVSLLVSGGHTLLLHAETWGEYTLLGRTRDDAAGEAFDKVAKLLGLPYPGGPAVETIAREGDPGRHRLTRPMLRGNQRPGDADFYDFSFSGLKTAVGNLARRVALDMGTGDPADLPDSEKAHIARAFQDAAIDVLVSKTLRAVEETGCDRVVLGGGVSANGVLRSEMERRSPGGRVFWASPRLSLDNGAMVARAARFRFDRGEVGALDGSASAGLAFPGLSTASREAAIPRT
ncbi:MAG: tRNA (adenosine(37)-N6)-threonylcarbamoyltransferase complex transferase subunit TsaD [Gemmatimonadetes bacterium]|nr:tRNA (adenosine(37)-N6)-threonylcarbamoyltransferase complex transferase subunit TsaD [Gemmatimonadota bacterium]NNF12495.1 tRNA (adenosine(37)-N6)-threonylcarbamoyltransferase complex transferase subunit TsaD [Gemmatimonadota bacterium]NNL30242.1 tRNA (adenosine(37)-N6)-threonylcarbamoyltransferase complex transferase subunit TsaD [Gemmatimonadota bacterium]